MFSLQSQPLLVKKKIWTVFFSQQLLLQPRMLLNLPMTTGGCCGGKTGKSIQDYSNHFKYFQIKRQTLARSAKSVSVRTDSLWWDVVSLMLHMMAVSTIGHPRRHGKFGCAIPGCKKAQGPSAEMWWVIPYFFPPPFLEKIVKTTTHGLSVQTISLT